MRYLARSIVITLLVVCSATATANPLAEYNAVRAARPDGRKVELQNFVFERDVLRFTLNGTLHLLTPVEGKESGAVFIGQGSYELTPASVGELRHLRILTGDEKLATIADQFDSAVFLGAALAAKAGVPVTGSPDRTATERYERYLQRQREKLHTNVHVRVLQDILDGGEPFFFAFVEGKKYPPAALIVDPRGADAVRIYQLDGGGEQTMMAVIHDQKGGVWYSSRLRSEIEKGQGAVVLPPADAAHYAIEATINGAQVSATSIMTFSPNSGLRVLPIELTPKLRIAEASYAVEEATPSWLPAGVIQEPHNADADAAVVFPTALASGQRYLLRMTYSGTDVLTSAGDGNFTIGSRASWYPNLGTFSDPATFDLTFRTPQKFQIVAVGDEIQNRVEGEQRVAIWKSTQPLRVAGFNYGRFKKLAQADKDSGVAFEVYTNPGEPDIIKEINMILGGGMQEMGDPTEASFASGPTHVRVDTASLAQSALADGINTARTANAFFGPLKTKRVAITQQSQWFFGQSWPGLIYLPYVSFLNGTVRNTLGLNDAKDFVDNVGAHELAHQWWGHQVAPRTYRDAWISEGFAEFTAALVAQQTGGWPRYDAFWEKARRNILERTRGATVDNWQAGPISQGARLSTWRNDWAYSSQVYSKGAYVLHMLRMAMMQGNDESAFMTMMKEFASTYAGKTAGTRDFQRMVEKHATPSLKITKDGKMNWFFDQWVYGTSIPKITSKFAFQNAGNGKYKVTGSVTQSEVDDQFASIVPIYVHFDKNSSARLGNVIMIGSSTEPVEFEIALPKKPQRFTVNSMHNVLSR